MAEVLSLAVRTVHVLAMAALLGGAVATWLVAREGLADPLAVAARYEWAFWGAVGVLVATGVGNLGALGPPGPGSAWGRTLTWKLGLVAAFVLGSLVRTLAVVRATGGAGVGDATATPAADAQSEARTFTRRAYALTAWAVLALVVLAEVLAHG